jgi:hypothetical protein
MYVTNNQPSVAFGTATIPTIAGVTNLTLGGESRTNWMPAYLTVDTTNYVSTNMTQAAIQAVIDAIPKLLNGHTAKVVFSNGTYALTSALEVKGFLGGQIRLTGIDGLTTLHSNQNVTLSGGTSTSIFNLNDNQANVFIQDFKLSSTTTGTVYQVLAVNQDNVVAEGCYFLGTSTAGTAYGTYLSRGHFVVQFCYFSNINYAMSAWAGSMLGICANGKTGTTPLIGHYASGGMIQRLDANVIGTTDNSVAQGGVIITSEGLIHP